MLTICADVSAGLAYLHSTALLPQASSGEAGGESSQWRMTAAAASSAPAGADELALSGSSVKVARIVHRGGWVGLVVSAPSGPHQAALLSTHSCAAIRDIDVVLFPEVAPGGCKRCTDVEVCSPICSVHTSDASAVSLPEHTTPPLATCRPEARQHPDVIHLPQNARTLTCDTSHALCCCNRRPEARQHPDQLTWPSQDQRFRAGAPP